MLGLVVSAGDGRVGRPHGLVSQYLENVSRRALVKYQQIIRQYIRGREGVYALYQGLGSVEDIDKANRLGLNHPMGPLELADLVGIDTIVNVLEILYEGHGDPKYFPCPLLRQMVVAGHLGRKTGKGFYDYSGKEKKPAL